MTVRRRGLLLAGLAMLAAGGMLSTQPAFVAPAATAPQTTEMAGHLVAFFPDSRHATEWQLLAPYLDNFTYVLSPSAAGQRVLATFAAPAMAGEVVLSGIERYRGTDPDSLSRELRILHVESMRAR